MNKKKLLIISASYPFGSSETFLENEIKFLHSHFSITVLPIKKKNLSDIPRDIPQGLMYECPVLSENTGRNVITGVLNSNPVLHYSNDLNIIRKTNNAKSKIKALGLDLIKNRLLYKKLVKNNFYDQFDVIYFYWGSFTIETYSINKPVFVRIHGGELDLERNRNYIPAFRQRFSNKSNITYLPISENAQNLLLKQGNFRSIINRLGVYDHGLNPDSVKNEQLHIVSCSNLIKLKRVNLIIEALKNITVPVKWTHFGDGPLNEEIKDEISQLPDNVTAELKGRLPNQEIMKYYQQNPIDLFINVSEIEGVPVSIMEALSFGIPCFATNVGGTAEIVDETVGKIINKDFEISELTDYIANFSNNNIEQLRKNARLRWQLLCNAETNYKELTNILNS